MSVEIANCVPADTTTTTSSSTTTTEGEVTTTTGGPGNKFTVLFTLDTASTGVGALQFTADYSGAGGEFDGEGAAVVCSNQVVGALFAPNDKDASDELTLGIIALSPFTARS